MNEKKKKTGENSMTKGYKGLILCAFFVVSCNERPPVYLGNGFIRDFVLKLNHLGPEVLSPDKDFALIKDAQKMISLGERVNESLSREEYAQIEQEWKEGLTTLTQVAEKNNKVQLLELSIWAYLSHLKGVMLLLGVIENRDLAKKELAFYAQSFSSLKNDLLGQADLETDTKAAILELRNGLNTALIDVREWPSQLSLPESEYASWFLAFENGNDDLYLGHYFDRMTLLKGRVFDIQTFVDPDGRIFRKESIKNDFDLDYEMKWQTDLAMATLQIKHFLWIRNEFEVMKSHLMTDRNMFQESDQTYEPQFLAMLMDRILFRYATLLLADLKWVMLEEMKATGNRALKDKISKDTISKGEPALLGLDQHDQFLGLVALYVQDHERGLSGDFLETRFVFERLYDTVLRAQTNVRSQKVLPLFVLDYYPQWKPMWDLFTPRGNPRGNP